MQNDSKFQKKRQKTKSRKLIALTITVYSICFDVHLHKCVTCTFPQWGKSKLSATNTQDTIEK